MANSGHPRGIALDLTLRELNPNHKYRMLLTAPPALHWLAELGVVKSDESVYLMPLVDRSARVAVLDSSKSKSYEFSPNSGMHISFHESGAINLFLGEDKLALRTPASTRSAIGPLFAIAVNSTAILAPATVGEINRLPARKRALPIMGGPWLAPVVLTVFRSAVGSAWTAPALADLSQVNVHLPVRDKSVRYHVVVWQNRRFKAPPGDIAISILSAK
jgi:hypothetical protein